MSAAWFRGGAADYRRALRTVLLLLVGVSMAACSSLPATSLKASAPFVYPSSVGASLERVAVLVTITNNSQDDLAVDPALFVASDPAHHVYPANVPATASDASSVRAAAGLLGMNGVIPLPVLTLRQNDVLSGFLVFDVPQGVRPVELIFRQSDSDIVVSLPLAR